MFKTPRSTKTLLFSTLGLFTTAAFAVDNGIPAKSGERPHTIFIDQELSLVTASPKTACTATLLSETVALTAAHCISDYFDESGNGKFRVALKTGLTVTGLKKLGLKNVFIPMSYIRADNADSTPTNFSAFLKNSSKSAALDFAIIEFKRSVPRSLGIRTRESYPQISRKDHRGLSTPVEMAGFGKDAYDSAFTLAGRLKKRLGSNQLSADRSVVATAEGQFGLLFSLISMQINGEVDLADLKADASAIFMDAGTYVMLRKKEQTDLQITNKGDSGSALYSRDSKKIIGITSQGLGADLGIKLTTESADGEVVYDKLSAFAPTASPAFSAFVNNAINCKNNSAVARLKKRGSCLSIRP